jgi:hypothetical protein
MLSEKGATSHNNKAADNKQKVDEHQEKMMAWMQVELQ